MRRRSEAQSGRYGGYDYRWVSDWQSVQSGLITCWNIWIDKREDCELFVLQYYAVTRSLYIQEGPQDKGRKTARPEPVLGDSVMSGCLLISGRLLISHVRTPPHLRTPPYSDISILERVSSPRSGCLDLGKGVGSGPRLHKRRLYELRGYEHICEYEYVCELRGYE